MDAATRERQARLRGVRAELRLPREDGAFHRGQADVGDLVDEVARFHRDPGAAEREDRRGTAPALLRELSGVTVAGKDPFDRARRLAGFPRRGALASQAPRPPAPVRPTSTLGCPPGRDQLVGSAAA
jgi:hypothetical protein